MVEHVIQASFNSGEWSPKLYGRVDLARYRSGAALLENFFVDYRGGASTRPGTKYILQCYKSDTAVRLIPFQASFTVGYALEFGDRYIRFFFLGAPVLENIKTITGYAAGVFTSNAHGYLNGDWIFAENAYYIITSATTNTFALTDLFGNAIVANPFTLPTSAQRIYTISSPYTAAELTQIKYAQNVNQLIICHPNHPPHVLSLITAASWTLLPITIGTTASAPTPPAISITPGDAQGKAYYSYVVTAIDSNGQESNASGPGAFGPNADIRTTANTIKIVWTALSGAVSYNVYKANISYSGVPAGATYGYIGSATGVVLIDNNISPDFSQTPPIARNPFVGNGVASVTVTSPGTYTTVPAVNFIGTSSTIAASASAILQVQSGTVAAGGTGYAVDDSVAFTNGVILKVLTVASGAVTAWGTIINGGTVTSGSTPSNPVTQLTTSGSGRNVTANLIWGVGQVTVTSPGGGYVSTPTVSFSSGAATATAALSSAAGGNPTVPGFFQQRLVLAAPNSAPQTFYMSKPGQYFNFDVSVIAQANDAITSTLVSGQLNTIKTMVPQSAGLLMLTDRNSWLIHGGSGQGSAISPSSIIANAQSFNGVSDVPPIIANYDVLYIQSKGSIMRDAAYSIYTNVYTGTDISVISSHLFYGYTITEWAWAEEPFKLVWAIRSDGTMLTLTFLKEQEFIGWAHSITTNGAFKSVATVVEASASAGEVDAIYMVVQRTIRARPVKYIERIAERTFPTGVADAWTVDCGISYSGAPATSFSGAQFLGGQTVTGLADGVVIPPFIMPISGAFTLPAASKVTIGLGFIAKLKTLPLEIGDPTVQGKTKKINNVDVRVADTLGLQIGSDFTHLTPMKDLVRGNVSSMLTGQSSQIVTDLVTGDARTFLDPTYTIPGQYAIQQSDPLPATILAVIPNIEIGEGGRRT